MKFDHANSYMYIFVGESFDVEFDFTNIMASGDTLSTAVVTMTDSNSNDVTSTMISSDSVTSPYVYFTVGSTAADTSYEIKIKATSTAGKIYIGRISCESFDSITLNTKLGDPNANSYITLEEANDYIRNLRGHSDIWDTLSIEGKKRVLIEATKDIDRFNFVDDKYYDFQALQFPRDSHSIITGAVATPITISSFKNTSMKSSAYGNKRSNSDYWKYGTVHITSATPLYDVRNISANNISTDIITVSDDFSATPTTNTRFIAFEPLDKNIKYAQCEQALFILDNTNIDTIKAYGEYAKSVEIGDVAVDFKDSSSISKPPLSVTSKTLLSKWIEKHMRVYRG